MRCQAILLRQALVEARLDQTCLALLTGEPREATQAVFALERADPVETSRQFGNNCHLPGSYQGALQAFLRHRDSQDHQYQAVFSTTIGQVQTRLGSHWSRASQCCECR